jgi:PAS domain S-box-containing protein
VPITSTVSTQLTFREIFDHAPVGVALVSLDGRWIEVNERLSEITGYCRDELLASNWQKITHPDDLPENLDQLTKLAAGELQNVSFEKRYIRKDGAVIWVKISSSLMRDETTREPLHIITIVDEITEYKRAQEQRLTAEEKWSKAFRQSPTAMAILSLKEQRFVEVNDAFVAFTGYDRAEATSRRADEIAFLDNSAALQEMAKAVMAGNRVKGWEESFRTKDGRTGSAVFFVDQIEINGEPCVIGAALDITDRKRLETELQELSGRLIEAQDEERKRISAELTDSLGQSITVISFEASQLARTAQGELVPELNSLAAKIRDVSAGIEIVSQSLHPSGLDYTGLPWAIEGLCRQITHIYGLQVALKHENIPSTLPADVALGLYRIVQEGLINVVRHSGTRQAWIELTSDGTNIRLNLWDNGVGFNPFSVKAGLGLLMMRERCRRLNGWMAIRTENGTHIEAQIPLANSDADLFK